LEHEAHASLLRLRLERRAGGREQLRRIDALAREILRAALQARDLEQPLHHAHEAAGLPLDDLRRGLDRRAGGLAIGDGLRESLDRRERRTQLVRYVREEGLFTAA